jgi:serine/threonine protein kinase
MLKQKRLILWGHKHSLEYTREKIMASIPHPIGKYRILQEIASGSFGRVYLAEDTSRRDYPVAIKFMHVAHLTSLQERNSFLQEAQLLTLLRHPYIIPVLDLGIEEEIPYLVMEYAPNGSLHDRLRQMAPRPLLIRDALTILGQVGAALQYAHQQNVIHRDLKPANILFNAQGDALLADFGIATMLSSSIKSGTVVGTPYYMAPERFRGTISKESDQYALGCIAYQAMTGCLPFDSLDFIALGFKHMSETPIPPTQLNRLISPSVEAAIMKAIAKERTQRFPDIRSFVAALEGTLPSSDALPAPAPLPTTGGIPPVVQPQQADGYNPTAVPRRQIEEGGQPVLPVSDHGSGDWLIASASSPSYLGNTPTRAEVPPGSLSGESPGVVTPYHGAMSWYNYGRDEQEDIPTILNAGSAARLGAEEERTLRAGPPGTLPVGGSLPPGPQTWPNPAPARQQKSWRGSPLVIAAIIALMVVLIGGGVLYAMTGIIQRSPKTQGQVHALPPAPTLLPGTAQASITPRQTSLDKTYTIYAVLGTPNSSNQQVQARSISSTSATQSATVSATGQGTISAKEATGNIYMKNLLTNSTLTYYAHSSQSYFVAGSYTVYLSQGGVLQPGASATIPAYATPAGSGGNLAAGAINGNYSCNNGNLKNCAYVYNNAFSGGSNASSYTYVSQTDVNNANNSAISQYASGETATAKSNVEGQMSSNEQMLNGIGCSQHLSDNQSVGNHASSVTASISVSCSVEVYDSNGAQHLATSLLQNSITRTPGEKLVGQITTNVRSVSGGSNGTIVVQVEAKGAEISTFSATQLQSLKALIAGQSVQEAQAILDRQPGVSKAVVMLSGGDQKTLPKDTKDITIVLASG